MQQETRGTKKLCSKYQLIPWFLRIFYRFQDFLQIPLPQNVLEWREVATKERNEYPVLCFKPWVSCLWGCGESVNLPRHPEVQGALSSRPKRRPRPASGIFIFVKSHIKIRLVVEYFFMITSTSFRLFREPDFSKLEIFGYPGSRKYSRMYKITNMNTIFSCFIRVVINVDLL